MEDYTCLEELHSATKALAKNKVPGRDGVPVEFYLQIWESMGPVLLSVLQKGIADGFLSPKLTEGVVILLEKKGDQLFIGNKRGLTLLNSALKILTKLY